MIFLTTIEATSCREGSVQVCVLHGVDRLFFSYVVMYMYDYIHYNLKNISD